MKKPPFVGAVFDMDKGTLHEIMCFRAAAPFFCAADGW